MRIPYYKYYIIDLYFCSLDTEPTPTPSHAPSPSPGGSLIPPPKDPEPVYSPYTDDPEAQGGYNPGIMLQTQKQMMDGKSTLLSYLLPRFFRVHVLTWLLRSPW